MQLTKRRENKAKLELANRTDKTESAQREIVEWESKVQRCQQEFEEISKEIKKEMERFDIKRVSEFKSIIIKYLEDSMAHQQQVLFRTQTHDRLKRFTVNILNDSFPKNFSSPNIGTGSFQPPRKSHKRTSIQQSAFYSPSTRLKILVKSNAMATQPQTKTNFIYL